MLLSHYSIGLNIAKRVMMFNHRRVFNVMLPCSSSSGKMLKNIMKQFDVSEIRRGPLWHSSKVKLNSAGEAPQGHVEVSETQM